MLGKEPEGLDVEDKLLRGAVDPESAGDFVWQGIVGAIDFDNGKLAGIEAQTPFSATRPGRIEPAAGYERGFRPRRNADQDVTHGLILTARSHSLEP